MNERLGAYQVVSDMFGFLGGLQEMPSAGAQTLIDNYPEDLESGLSAKLIHFDSLSRSTVLAAISWRIVMVERPV